MTTMSRDPAKWPIESRTCWLDAQMAEVSLLVPAWQAAEMERLAHARGLTSGQMIRLLIRDYLTDRAGPGPVSKPTVGSLAILRGVRFDSSRR